MPAFMFEKILPPVHHVQSAVIKEPRGVIVQMLDRLAENRLQREARELRKARLGMSFTEADIKPT